jgi:hypothetical protein
MLREGVSSVNLVKALTEVASRKEEQRKVAAAGQVRVE